MGLSLTVLSQWPFLFCYKIFDIICSYYYGLSTVLVLEEICEFSVESHVKDSSVPWL